jgi:hypothetical protein
MSRAPCVGSRLKSSFQTATPKSHLDLPYLDTQVCHYSVRASEYSRQTRQVVSKCNYPKLEPKTAPFDTSGDQKSAS